MGKCVAKWIFTKEHLKNGDITDNNIYFEDVSGNGNHIELVVYNENPENSDKSGILEFINEDGVSALSFKNKIDTGFGKYFKTVETANINKMKFETGYTIEVEVKIPKPGQFDPWMGIFTRLGTGEMIGKTIGEKEILMTLAYNDSFQWTWYATNSDENQTCWSICFDDIDSSHFVNASVRNDGKHTRFYLNGVSDIRNVSDEVCGIEIAEDGSFVIAAGLWDNKLSSLFSGAIASITVYDYSHESQLSGVFRKSLFDLNGTNEKLPLKTKKDTDTLAIFPDTQYMGQYHPVIIDDMVAWCCDKKEDYNIKAILHVGDIAENSYDKEFLNGEKSFNIAKEAKMPFMVTAGNHDSRQNCDIFAKYFGKGCYKDFDNIVFDEDSLSGYIKTTLSGKEVMLLNINSYRMEKSIAWCNKVIKDENLPTIVFSHDIFDYEGTSSVQNTENGDEIFKTIVNENPNVFMVIAGHMFGIGHKIVTVLDREVIAMLTNYQSYPNGGNGYLQLAEFDFDRNKLNVSTYSPWVANQKTEDRDIYGFEQLINDRDRFSIDFDFGKYFK